MPVLAWLALALIWGSTWLAIRVGLDYLPPFTFAGLRFLLASAVLLGILAALRVPLPRRPSDWKLIAVTGLGGLAVSYGAQFWGMQFVPSGLAAVMFSTVPLFTLVFAHLRLPAEPMTTAKLGGVTLGILGVAVIFADQLTAATPRAVWGSAAFLIGAAAMSAGQVTVKARGAHLHPMVLASLQMGVTGIALFGVGVTFEGNPLRHDWTPAALLSLGYLVLFGSALGFFLFYWLIKHMEVTKTLSVMLTHPPTAIILGWLFLGETLGWRVFVGAAGIIMGLSMILTPRRVPAPAVIGEAPTLATPSRVLTASRRGGCEARGVALGVLARREEP